jgi:hypothetical protein
VAALKQAVNLLIVNSQGIRTSSNLLGTTVFAIQKQVEKIPAGPQGIQGPVGPAGPAGPPGPSSFPDAPNDSTLYARKSLGWSHVAHTDITDWTTTLAPYALLASPIFTGIPAAPTAALGVNTTQLATTAFVSAAMASIPVFATLPVNAANDAAAATAGVPLNGVYRNGSVLMVRTV